jgi:hypothetical protein
MFTDYNRNLGSCEGMYTYAYVDTPDNLRIYTQQTRSSGKN